MRKRQQEAEEMRNFGKNLSKFEQASSAAPSPTPLSNNKVNGMPPARTSQVSSEQPPWRKNAELANGLSVDEDDLPKASTAASDVDKYIEPTTAKTAARDVGRPQPIQLLDQAQDEKENIEVTSSIHFSQC